MAGILDHDIGFVAAAGQAFRNPRKQVVEYADYPARAFGQMSPLPCRELCQPYARNFWWRQMFVAGTEWACPNRIVQRLGIRRGRIRVQFIASAQGEGEAFAANVDDVRNDPGYRILD